MEIGMEGEKLFAVREMKEIKMHVEIGHRIAQSIPELYPIADLLLKHHEWWNGEGYPDRLAGEEIPLAARILRVADSYAAMTDNRPRRIARTDTEARQAMIELAGIEFDPKVVHRFFNVGIQPLRRDG